MRKLLFLLVFLAGLSAPVVPVSADESQNGLYPEEIVTADELKKMFDDRVAFVLFDARDKRSFDTAHIQGAVLPRSESFYQQEELFRTGLIPASPDPKEAFKTAMNGYARDTAIVTYCNSNCHASATLALQLKVLGFTNVKSMEEGIQIWEKKLYPVVRQEPPKAP